MDKFSGKEENERKRRFEEEDEGDVLNLSLSLNRSVRARQENINSPLLVPYTASTNLPLPRVADVGASIGTSRSGRNRRRVAEEEKSDTIPPPFPWATDRRAFIHSHKHLVDNNILTITGNVQCKRCEKKFEMEFNLDEKLAKLWMFIQNNNDTMHDRAPKVWMDPVLPKCEYCGQENSVRPLLVNTKKKEINWLFLLLGQMIGCCTLEQLKYFCKHTNNHRTGAKDRLLYSTYMGLCRQLLPEWFI
ncbi:hypothetical protein VNO77_11571 [Canavalia gladiata]|uniref:DUF7086 domain-containing protein n=1 Tax=Canavalia gladiata TaxID=3824 RepID=A0AAN9MC44_CANGL